MIIYLEKRIKLYTESNCIDAGGVTGMGYCVCRSFLPYI